MKVLRKILGILVMCAGVLGLVLSLAGLVAIWAFKPVVASSVDNTITMLNSAVTTSQQAMQIAGEALGGTVESVNALSTMLGATATSVQDTQPMLDQIKALHGREAARHHDLRCQLAAGGAEERPGAGWRHQVAGLLPLHALRRALCGLGDPATHRSLRPQDIPGQFVGRAGDQPGRPAGYVHGDVDQPG